MEPTAAVGIIRSVILLGKNEKLKNGIAAVIAALCLPVLLGIVCAMCIAAGGAEHNRAAVRLSFHGGAVPSSMPKDYRTYIGQMQESFGEIDRVFDELDLSADGEYTDRYLVKAVFYSLFFGEARLRLETEDYVRFAECFVRYEERTRIVEMEDGTETEEYYSVAVPVTDKVEIFSRLASEYGIKASYEQQSNAVNIWYLAKYGITAPQEGDVFEDWGSWYYSEDVFCYDLPVSESGSRVLELAMSRIGDPYSQAYRGTGSYVDCSYLVLWCYRQVGINLPGTAAEQARYLVENNLTVSRGDLQPGDLVFWSHKPNGRFMNITHVGVYAGEGKIVDASYSKGQVVYRNMFDNDKQMLYGRPL